MKSTQCARLLAHMRAGHRVTPLNAWDALGIYRLGARVYDLRQQGHAVRDAWRDVRNRWGETCRVKEYWLATEGGLF